MEEWLEIVTATAAVFAVFGLGFMLRRQGVLTRHADESLLKLVVRVLMPCLIFKSILGNPAVDDPSNLYLPPIVGFVTLTLGVGLAWLTARAMRGRIGLGTPAQQRTFAVSVGVYNYGYVAIPLAQSLYPPEVVGGPQPTIGVLFVHNVGVEIAMWTVCVAMIGGRLGRASLKGILNPPVIAIAAGLLLNAVNGEQLIPAFVTQALNMLGESAIPVALLLIGATMADHFRKQDLVRGKKLMGAAVALRLGLIPLLFLGIAAVTPGTVELQRVIVLQAAMPAAVFPIVLARHYGGDVHVAVRVSLATAVVSLFTMPTWLAIGSAWVLE